MNYLGDYKYGQTIYVPFASYNSSGASVTLTGLAVTDIEAYKNGSVTQRASDAGYTLLDTDGIDFDGITGIHGFSIDTSDNTTAGFWGPGNDYFVAVSAVTIDSQTVNFEFQFSIENRGGGDVLARTTIATLASQTSFTLTAGSADDDAYNNCLCVVQDVASVVQKAVGIISDYTGSTKTVTLQADPAVFTMATTDYVTILADKSLKPTVTSRFLDVTATGAAGIDWNNVENPTTTVVMSGTTVKTATDVETDTADIQTRIPAALSSGNMKADVLAINTSTASASNLNKSAGTIVQGTAITGTLSTTQMTTDLTEATDDHYIGRVVIWTSGVLLYQATRITDYNGTTKLVTYNATTEAPSNTDAFVIV